MLDELGDPDQIEDAISLTEKPANDSAKRRELERMLNEGSQRNRRSQRREERSETEHNEPD